MTAARDDDYDDFLAERSEMFACICKSVTYGLYTNGCPIHDARLQ